MGRREPEAIKKKLPPVQLYDLNADQRETTNLAGSDPEVVEQLTGELRRTIEQGRSTDGPDQPNHAGEIWWRGLPWEKSNVATDQ